MLRRSWTYSRAVALSVVVAGACVFATNASRAVANSVVEPDISSLEPGVRSALEEGRREFRDAQAKASGPEKAGEAWGRLGMIYQAHHLQSAAADCYKEAARLDPEDFRWFYLAGFVDQEAGRLDAALAHYEETLSLNPDYLPAVLRQGQVLLASRRYDEANEQFEAVLIAQPRSAAALAGLGKVSMTRKDYPNAIRRLEQALALDPGASSLRYTLGMAYRQEGKLDLARANLDQRGEVEPRVADPVLASMAALSRSAQIYLEQGYAASRAGRDREAVAQFRKAVEFNPEDTTALVSLGQGLATIGEYEEAMQYLDRALAIDPDSETARYRRATLFEMQGDDEAAAREFEKVLAHDPDHLRARYRMAEALMRLGRYAAAAEAYARIEATPAQAGLIKYGQGIAQLAAWDCAAAIDSLERALELRPDSGEIYQALARAYATCPGVDDARRATSLNYAQQLFQVRATRDHAEALAMAAAANGRFERANQIQQQLLATAKAGGNERAVEWHSRLAARYAAGARAERPWPTWHPVYRPGGAEAGPGGPGSR